MKQSIKYIAVLIFIDLLIILVVGIVLNLFNNFNEYSHLKNDCFSYYESALKLYSSFTPDNIRPIGISFIFGVPFLFTKSIGFFCSYVIVLQMTLWLITNVFIFKCLKLYIDNRTSFIASLFYSFALSPVILIYFVLSEISFIFLIVVGFYFLIKYLKSLNVDLALISMFLFLLSALIKPMILYILPLLIIYILFKLYINKTLIYKYFFAILIIISTIGFQFFMMYQYFHIFTLSDQSSRVFYMLGAHSESIRLNKNLNVELVDWVNECKDKSDGSIKSLNKISDNKFWVEFYEHPYYVSKAYLITLKYNIINGSRLISPEKNFNYKFTYKITVIQNIFFSCILLIQIILFIYLFFIKKLRTAPVNIIIISLLLSIYIYLMGGLFYWQGDRYNLPAYPFIIICSVLLISILKKKHEAINNYPCL